MSTGHSKRQHKHTLQGVCLTYFNSNKNASIYKVCHFSDERRVEIVKDGRKLYTCTQHTYHADGIDCIQTASVYVATFEVHLTYFSY